MKVILLMLMDVIIGTDFVYMRLLVQYYADLFTMSSVSAKSEQGHQRYALSEYLYT